MYSKLLSIGGGKERIQYFLNNYANTGAVSVNEELIKTIHQTKTDCYKKRLENPIPLRLGVLRLLKELMLNSVYIALVTTSSKTATESFLKSSLPPYLKFDCIVTGDDVQNKKPHPEIYRKALEKLSLKSKETIAIEDSRTGLISAIRNQIPVIITPSFFTKNDNFQEAYSVISHLGEFDMPFEHIANHPLLKTYVDLEVLKSINL